MKINDMKMTECVVILLPLSYLRCCCPVPHLGGQELGLQEANVYGAHILSL